MEKRPVPFILLLVLGCGEELPAFQYEARTVTGRVTFQGKAVAGGWIEFIPIDGTVGNIVTARLTHDGRYVAHRVAVGRHQVMIVRTDPPLPPELSTSGSTLQAVVRRDGDHVLDFRLP